jgi:hypothetical protein
MIIFSKNLEMSKFKISKLQNMATMEPKLQMVHSWFIDFYTYIPLDRRRQQQDLSAEADKSPGASLLFCRIFLSGVAFWHPEAYASGF